MWTRSIAAGLRIAALACCALLAATAGVRAAQDWDADWTVLAVGANGAWGSATGGSRSAVIAGAIAACERSTSGAAGRCGGSFVTVRAAWSLAYTCGETAFLVTGASYHEARAAAINHEIELKEIERMALEPCRMLVAIDPEGRKADTATTSAILPVIGTSYGPR